MSAPTVEEQLRGAQRLLAVLVVQMGGKAVIADEVWEDPAQIDLAIEPDLARSRTVLRARRRTVEPDEPAGGGGSGIVILRP